LIRDGCVVTNSGSIWFSDEQGQGPVPNSICVLDGSFVSHSTFAFVLRVRTTLMFDMTGGVLSEELVTVNVQVAGVGSSLPA
jgi:hypothetical protein